MIFTSRPIRFLTAILGGWVGLRVAILWPGLTPTAVLPTLIRAIAPPAAAESSGFTGAARRAIRTRPAGRPVSPPFVARAGSAPAAAPPQAMAGTLAPRNTLALVGLLPFAANGGANGLSPPPGTAPPLRFGGASRWSGSAWAIMRPGGRATPFTSQLGGSQTGARIAFALDDARDVAVYARVSSAIAVRQREAAVGIDWRPTRLPIHLVAEQRITIEGTRGGPALGVVGGFGPLPVTRGVRAEAYAQAGVIFRDGSEGFADGALRLTTPVAPRLDLGVGAWGAAQRGASRLDAGPTLAVTLPVNGRTLRLSVDWRQRLAGDARPGSGPALSLGADF